jgi:pyruvate carboxylase subunit B
VEVEVPEGEPSLQTVLSVFQTGVIKKVEAQPTAKDTIIAPITGKVNQIVVSQGQKVSKGDVIAKIEAMKTLIEVKSNLEGTVAEIYVKEGDVVKQGQPLLKIV